MTKIKLLLVILALACSGYSATVTITANGLLFVPDTVRINLGDTIKFTIGGIHQPEEVSQATWNANLNTPLPGFSVPINGGLVLPAKLTTGTHYYVCNPHASAKMKGVIIVQATSGISEIQLNERPSLYPNPTNGKFQLTIPRSLDKNANYEVKIYDVHGKVVYSTQNLKSNVPNEIDLSSIVNITKGSYIVKVYSGVEIFSKKITLN